MTDSSKFKMYDKPNTVHDVGNPEDFHQISGIIVRSILNRFTFKVSGNLMFLVCSGHKYGSCFLFFLFLLYLKAIPLHGWTGPESSRRLRLPRFQDNRHMKVVRLSALRAGRIYILENIPGTHFC